MNNPFSAEITFTNGSRRIIRYHIRDWPAVGVLALHIKDQTGAITSVVMVNMGQVETIEIDGPPPPRAA